MSTYAERRAARSRAALADLHALAAWAERRELVLLLDRQIDEVLTLAIHDLPDACLDGRQDDALGRALADPGLLLVTAGGHWWGTPITGDRRFLRYGDRPWAVFGVSRLSGGYYGLVVKGREPTRFLHGVEEVVEQTELTLRLASGVVVAVERTTLGFRLSGPRPDRAADLEHLLRHLDQPVTAATSDHIDAAALAELLDRTGAAFADGPVEVNGRTWRRTLSEVPVTGPGSG